MRPTQEEQQRQEKKKRRSFGFRRFGSVSLVLLLVCLKVAGALKMQGVDAYIGAKSIVTI
jgi:hypothetical protein